MVQEDCSVVAGTSVNMGQQKPDYKVISVQEDTAWHVNLIQTSIRNGTSPMIPYVFILC